MEDVVPAETPPLIFRLNPATRKAASRRVRRPVKTDRGTRVKGCTGIYITEDGAFRVLITATLGDKRVFRERLVEGSLNDAKDAQSEMRKELEKEAEVKQVAGSEKDTIQGFSNLWISYLKNTETKPSTISSYQEKLKAHILPFWKDKRLKEIKPKQVSEWLAWMTEKQSHYARKTMHSAWRTFCSFVRWACVQCNLPSPVENIRFNCRGKDETEKTSLTSTELKRVIDSLGVVSEPYRSMVLLAATTGARIGEIIALRWSEIDLEGGILKICRSCTRGIVTETTKTKRVRYVPLVTPAKAALMDLKASGHGADGGLIFRNTKGKPHTAKDFTGPLAQLAKAAELGKRITPHSFRRAANDLLRQAAGEIVARSILGHTTPQMTAHYATVHEAEGRAALEKVLELGKEGKASALTDAGKTS